MGLEILLIIFFHFVEDCKVYNVRYGGFIRYFYEFIRSSGVDVFLVLSGLGLYYSWRKNQNYKLFLEKRFARIMIPYLLVAILAWGWRDLFVDRVGIIQFVKDVSFISLFTQGTKWFWYIFMMAICYLLFPIIYNWIDKSKNDKICGLKVCCVFLISTIFAWGLRTVWYDMYKNINILIYRFPMFIFGCWIGKLSYEKQEIEIVKLAATGVSIIILLSMLKAFSVDLVSNYLRTCWNVICCLIVMTSMTWYGQKRIGTFIYRILEWCGSYSLELYLIHVAVRRIMNILGYHTYRYSYEVIMLVFSALLSVLLKDVTRIIQTKGEKRNDKG